MGSDMTLEEYLEACWQAWLWWLWHLGEPERAN